MSASNQQEGRQRDGSSKRGSEMDVGVLKKEGLIARRERRTDPMARVVERCQEGDPAAFRALYDRYAAGVHRHLCVLIGPGEDVDDLIQLVFLNVFQSIDRFKGRSAFSTWLFRITVNVARQEIRQRKRRRRLDAAVHEVSEVRGAGTRRNPEKQLSEWQEIYDVLDRLPPKKRETYVLYTYEGCSLSDIAQLLNSSISTIGSRLQSARKELLRALEGGSR